MTRPPKPHELKKLPITKLDAARRQLETAITLWFHDADPVSVHTLVMAAHGILRALNKKRGGQPMLGDPSPYVRPGFEKKVADLIVESSNFFKHGGKDPLATHFFPPESNQIMIFDACNTFRLLAQEMPPLMGTFNLYLSVHEPGMFLPEFIASLQQHEPTLRTAKKLSKAKFFAEWLPIAFSAPFLPMPQTA
jgi:hypothetical protein